MKSSHLIRRTKLLRSMLMLMCLTVSASWLTAAAHSELKHGNEQIQTTPAIPAVSEQQQKGDHRTITGQVADSQGEALIGVSILVKGTTNGGVTDLDGNYSITTDVANPVLIFSYVGYKTKEVVVGNQKVVNMVMEDDTQVIEAVVVTALGIKRAEKALSYNVQEIKGEALNTVKDANFMNALSGKIAGVNINASAAGVGGATRVVMRGTKSIDANKNNALYVIDGVPIFNSNNGQTDGKFSSQPKGEGISDINPDDIESMSVLSGPAAAALYGSNAAQGVILITTKKGKEGKVNITINNSSTFSNPFVMPKFQNTYANKAGEFRSWGDKGMATDYNPASFFNTGTNIQNTISMSTGNDKNQTYVSVGTTNATGLITDNKYNRYNFNVRNTTKFLNDKMTLDASFSYIKQDDANLMAQGSYFNPLAAVYLFPRGENFETIRLFETYDEGRNINVQNWKWETQSLDMQNPYWVSKRMPRTSNKQRYMATVSLKYDILDWLNLAARVRMDNAQTDYEEKRYASTTTLFAGPKGFYHFDVNDERQLYADAMANINKRIDVYSINANIGGSFSRETNKKTGWQGPLKNLPNVFDYFNIDPNGRDARPVYSGIGHQVNAVFASAELGWKSLIYLTLTGRYDWDSSLINTEQLGFFYPSVGLSGVISDMVKLPSAINYMKVRGSWAKVGSGITPGLSSNKAIEYDPATNSYKPRPYPQLKKLYPEFTNSWEAGLTTKLFNNKVNFDVTWYRTNTTKQTMKKPLSASSGYEFEYVQTGDIQNWGMEFSLGYSDNWNGFGWDTYLTYSFNKNKIIKLMDGNSEPISKGGIDASEYILQEGGTLGDLYVKTQLKRDENGNIYVNKNKQVEIEQLKTPEKVGSVLPDGNLGWRNEFTWKGFNLNALVTARLGGVVISHTQAYMDLFGVSQTTADARNNGGVWVNNGLMDAQKYYSVVGGSNGLLKDYVYSATNVRLQEVALGYNFPRKWFNNKIGLHVSVVGRNLLMIYNKAPFDPESTASTGTYFQGMDFFMQPSQRNIGFNVKLQF